MGPFLNTWKVGTMFTICTRYWSIQEVPWEDTTMPTSKALRTESGIISMMATSMSSQRTSWMRNLPRCTEAMLRHTCSSTPNMTHKRVINRFPPIWYPSTKKTKLKKKLRSFSTSSWNSKRSYWRFKSEFTRKMKHSRCYLLRKLTNLEIWQAWSIVSRVSD